ncbi:MAG: YbjQ family protein, partial [Spirochaetaceae bacterium]
MILVNTDFITGRDFETLGLVKGSTIRSKHLGKDILAAFKTIVGGELTAYQEMIQEARAIATKRMVDEATELQADAVINVRYATSSVTSNAAEV